MTLNEYIDKLIKFRDSDKKNGDLEVIYSSDSEGNYFNKVCHSPTKCVFNDHDWVQFYDRDEWDSEDDFEEEVDAVCIN